MKTKTDLIRLQKLINSVVLGLGGKPFAWGEGQRRSWVPILRKIGITLVSNSRIEKLGYRLKRNAQPVGSAYYGAPIQRIVDLYFLELQCVNKKLDIKECWLFLDCEQVTGKTPDKCPNHKQCKHNALNSNNRVCRLPYTFQHWHPKKDGLFKNEEYWLVVDRDAPEEAYEAGWYPPISLFYEYINNILIVKRFSNSLPKPDQEIAKQLGWAEAHSLPFHYFEEDQRLAVIGYIQMASYPQIFVDAGWYPAVDLPYYYLEANIFNEFNLLKVCFDGKTENLDYVEAINLGWHPAVDLPQ
ncbi:MAG: hypothetical protein WBB28_09430 [Crinalium sp.]